jgi:hypothetical protein
LEDENYEWTLRRQEALDELTGGLSSAPVLDYPHFRLPFILTTDAISIAVAAGLSQVKEGVERLISFASRQLNKAERAYSASEVEMLALVWSRSISDAICMAGNFWLGPTMQLCHFCTDLRIIVALCDGVCVWLISTSRSNIRPVQKLHT